MALVFGTFIITSCEKEDSLSKKVQQNEIVSNKNYELPAELKTNLKQVNDLVVFENKEQFDKISNLLILETEKYIESYFLKFDKSVTEEEVNIIVEEEGFNPNYVYEAFENYHSIASLRAELVILEAKWLDNSELEGDNPAYYPISERCLPIANANGEYQIGESIYRVEQSGTVYEIVNEDYTALETIRNAPELDLKSTIPNVIIHREVAVNSSKSTNESCLAYVRQDDWHKAYGNYKMYMIIDLDWDGYGSAAKAKTKAYRRKKKLFGGTKWGRHWTSMTAEVSVSDFTHGCTYQKTYKSGIKSRRWAYYVAVHVYASGKIIRTKKGGYFWGEHSIGSRSKVTYSW